MTVIMSTFTVTWRLEFHAKDIEEARALHIAALDAMDEAPCADLPSDGSGAAG